MSNTCDEELVKRAFQMALARRHPETGLLHHSDRGSQYPSRAYRLVLEHTGTLVSMSGKGNCWDNAVMESFFSFLKEECGGKTIYGSREEARAAVFPSIETYYHRIRRYSTLGYVSPLVDEQRFFQQTTKNV